MMAAAAGANKDLNSMTRLPADGDSVHSRSSRSTQSTPSLPLAPTTEKTKDEADQQDATNMLMSETAPDSGVSAAAADADAVTDTHEDKAGCTGNEGGSEVEHSTGLSAVGTICTSVNGARLSLEDATPRSPQEGCPNVRPEIEDSSSTIVDNGPMEEKGPSIFHEGADLCGSRDGEDAPKIEQSLEQTSTTAPSSAQDNGEPPSAVETGGIGTPAHLPVEAEAHSELVNTDVETEVVLAESEAMAYVGTDEELQGHRTLGGQGNEGGGEALIAKPPRSMQDEKNNPEMDKAEDSEVLFLPSKSFTGAMPGYVFKTGDKGLGFYVEGYVDQPAKGAPPRSHRPWNAGPGEAANRRGPLGPVPKPFKKIVPFLTKEKQRAAEESDMRPFMARMVAQKNSRGFQSTLSEREHVLDKHILHLLEKFSDPSFFKKKHGYNVHGQMLGKDGKMVVKVTPEKTEEEKARLPWYRKVYEDRLGKHLPSKRLGDSIEARREAYAYSRHFTAELNNREDELNRALTKTLKGQTKLEFITEDYQYPGAYDLHGKVILEKGAPVSNDLHRTDEQNERACTYRYKAIRRYRAAHEDILSAIAKKDKALQKMLKHTDPETLFEISEEAVTSSGMGVYRQKRRVEMAEGSENTRTESPQQPRPEQLRQKFSQTLKAEIKGRDKALLKEIAALDEDVTDQMVGEYEKGAEVLPGSWRQDPETLKKMQRRRKQLLAENAADRQKVVCPWRPGGKHIAQGPWQPFIPRDHRPPVRSASEGKAGAQNEGAEATARGVGGRGSTGGPGKDKTGTQRRPHTAPTNRRKGFMDAISPRARRVLAAQSPGTSLRSAFSTYSTDPFPLQTKHQHRSGLGSGSGPQWASARTEFSVRDFPPANTPGSRTDTSFRAWSEVSGSSTPPKNFQSRGGGGGGSGSKRPHSATAEVSRRIPTPPRRPATACGTRGTAAKSSGDAAEPEDKPESSRLSPTHETLNHDHERDKPSRELDVRSGPGVTVLWARLCGPSSDLIYKSSVWPEAPNTSRPTRRNAKPPSKSRTARGCAAGAGGHAQPGGYEKGSAPPETDGPSPAKEKERSTSVGSLEDLEDTLFASSSHRVNQRRRVFRGYAERSRRERTWDPGSAFYAEGASKHHTRASLPNGRRTRGANRAPSMSGARNRRPRSRSSMDVHPVDMDWEKVDIGGLDGATKEVEEALGEKLYAVATHPAQLEESFLEAQEMVGWMGMLLGCPEKEQERFRKQIDGNSGIGDYVSTISRLSVLWTAACGVVEIVRMIQRRRDLLKVFQSAEQERLPVSEFSIEQPDGGRRGSHSAPPTPFRAPSSAKERYEKRLEIAEFSIAIAESVKLWVSVVPWRVQVLYGGKIVLSSLRDEEETLAWPPNDPWPVLETGGGQSVSDGSEDVYMPPGPHTRQSFAPELGGTE